MFRPLPHRSIIPAERIEQAIFLIRGERVILDADLAILFGVSTKRFNEQVKRNRTRFPEDFVFRLTAGEAESLRSQFATASKRDVRYLPQAFTEHGVIMAANVLNSRRAVKGRRLCGPRVRKAEKEVGHERRTGRPAEGLGGAGGDHDEQIVAVIQAIRQMMEPPPEPPSRRMGFRPKP